MISDYNKIKFDFIWFEQSFSCMEVFEVLWASSVYSEHPSQWMKSSPSASDHFLKYVEVGGYLFNTSTQDWDLLGFDLSNQAVGGV